MIANYIKNANEQSFKKSKQQMRQNEHTYAHTSNIKHICSFQKKNI